MDTVNISITGFDPARKIRSSRPSARSPAWGLKRPWNSSKGSEGHPCRIRRRVRPEELEESRLTRWRRGTSVTRKDDEMQKDLMLCSTNTRHPDWHSLGILFLGLVSLRRKRMPAPVSSRKGAAYGQGDRDSSIARSSTWRHPLHRQDGDGRHVRLRRAWLGQDLPGFHVGLESIRPCRHGRVHPGGEGRGPGGGRAIVPCPRHARTSW